MLNDAEAPIAPISEPLIVPDLILDEIEVRGGRHVLKLIGKVTVPSIGRESAERRIVARFTVPIDAARALWTDLADALREEGGYGIGALKSPRRNSAIGRWTTEDRRLTLH